MSRLSFDECLTLARQFGGAFPRFFEVTHKVEYKPKPRPDQLTFRVTNDNGEQWVLNPVNLGGQTYHPIYFPLAFLTGRPEDNGRQAKLEMNLYYGSK